ncbi:hypothetical protein E0K89_007440 [Aquicoccus sp. SCR17]|nr:hypothetical protein [Carideicomes alvinocaridis]
MRVLITLFVLSLCAPVAHAQSWQVVDGSQTTLRGAMACALGGGADDYCFALGCTEKLPLHFGYYSRGIGSDRPVVPVEVSVDGTSRGRLLMENRDPGTGAELVAIWDKESHDYLREALAGGQVLTLLVDPSGAGVERRIPLSGSSAALQAALAQCPTGPRRVSDPVALEKAGMEADCASMGDGGVSYGEEFARQVDFDFDGKDDIVIDLGGAQCAGTTSMFCGSAGCSRSYWHAEEGGYRQVMSTYAYTEEFRQRPIMILKQHGNVCDRVGVETCTSTFEWTGEGFELIGRE